MCVCEFICNLELYCQRVM